MKHHVPISRYASSPQAAFPSALGAACLVLALLFPMDAAAQTDFWAAVDGPYGGATVRDMVDVPGEGVFAATTGGIFRAVGARWEEASTGLLTSDVRDLHVRADGTLLAATHGDGIYQWNGEAWGRLALAAQFTTSLAEAPSGRLLVATLSGIRYSDDGQAWFAASLDGIQATPRRVVSGDTFVFAATNAGVFRSADEGATWDFASFGMATFDVTALAAGPAGIVYAGVDGGACTIYRSRGNANLWTCIEPVTAPVSVTSLLVDASGRVHAGGFRHVFTSLDEGDTWSARVVAPTTIGALATQYGEDGAETLLAGTTGAGVYKLSPSTATWQPSQDGLFAPIRDLLVLPSLAVAATEGGVFYTSDQGRSWQRFSPESPLLIDTRTLAVDTDGRLLAGTVSGVWRLSEPVENASAELFSATWESVGPASGLRIGALTVGPDGRIWIGYHSGVQYMTPGGSWTVMPIQGDDGAFRDIGAIGVMENGSLIAGAAWDSWRLPAPQVPSSSQGAVVAPWSLVSTSELPWFDIQTMAVDGNRVLAGTRFSGVLETTDGGATWRQAAPGLGGQEDVQDIAFDRFGNPFIATFGSGIFQLNPFTRRWIPASTGLGSHLRVRSIAFDSAGNAWAGTVSGGLFAHLVTSVGVEEESGAENARRAGPAIDVWPNPARNYVNVSITAGPTPGAEVLIEIFDVTGRRVASAADVQIPTSHLAPGIYLLRVSHGGSTSTRTFMVAK
ncbi:MAG: hypothetical protein COV99_00230 [Bacteroidetes bacterium CG12_big_fil_rev_8_21_14_0_65_60_17]|nr:MAG: hypothetical protein COV99_00230 [Bacteroidetes bacterium CG12_big_fil_rev_8_21_14_0_65_60_17]